MVGVAGDDRETVRAFAAAHPDLWTEMVRVAVRLDALVDSVAIVGKVDRSVVLDLLGDPGTCST